MRVLRHVLAIAALVAASAVFAPPAGAAEAYAAAFHMDFYGENWPCNSSCTNSAPYSWASSTFTGISGGPSWDDSFNFAPVSISYTSTNCLVDDWYVTIDSSYTSGGGSNTGVLSMSLHRVGTVFTGSAYFSSNSGTGDGYYTMSGVVYPFPDVPTVNACLGGPKALEWFNWSGVMASASL